MRACLRDDRGAGGVDGTGETGLAVSGKVSVTSSNLYSPLQGARPSAEDVLQSSTRHQQPKPY